MRHRRSHLGETLLLARMLGQAVAGGRPSTRATDREKARVFARAVVLERCRLGARLELRLVGRRGLQQPPDRGDLLGTREMGGAGDRDLLVPEIGPQPHQR